MDTLNCTLTDEVLESGIFSKSMCKSKLRRSCRVHQLLWLRTLQFVEWVTLVWSLAVFVRRVPKGPFLPADPSIASSLYFWIRVDNGRCRLEIHKIYFPSPILKSLRKHRSQLIRDSKILQRLVCKDIFFYYDDFIRAEEILDVLLTVRTITFKNGEEKEPPNKFWDDVFYGVHEKDRCQGSAQRVEERMKITVTPRSPQIKRKTSSRSFRSLLETSRY